MEKIEWFLNNITLLRDTGSELVLSEKDKMINEYMFLKSFVSLFGIIADTGPGEF